MVDRCAVNCYVVDSFIKEGGVVNGGIVDGVSIPRCRRTWSIM